MNKAMIICGADTKELRPLSFSGQKSLIKLLGKPVIEYVMEFLWANGFDAVGLNAVYRKKQIEEYAETLKLNAEVTNDYSDCEVVVKSTVVCDFDLTEAIRFHNLMKSDLTVIGKISDSVRNSDIFRCDGNSRITEYTSGANTITDGLTDCGIYLISERMAERINNIESSPGMTIKELLNENFNIYGYEMHGSHIEIKDIETYMKACRKILDGNMSVQPLGHRSLDGMISAEARKYDGVKITPPVYIGRNVMIAKGSEIEAYTVLGDNVSVGRNCRIADSVIMDGVYSGEYTRIENSFIGENTRLLHGSSIRNNSIIGKNCVIGEGAVLEENSYVKSNRRIENGKTVCGEVKDMCGEPLTIDDSEICGETNAEITPSAMAFTGECLAVMGKRIVVGYCGNDNSSKALAYSFMAGATSGGAEIFDIGEASETHIRYVMNETVADYGMFIRADTFTRARIFSKYGLELSETEENKFKNLMRRRNVQRVSGINFGEICDTSQLKILCEKKLEALEQDKINIRINTTNKSLKKLCEKVLPDFDYRNIDKKEIIFQISSDGRSLSAFTEEYEFVPKEKLQLVCCRDMLERGEKVIIPYGFSSVADRIAESLGKEVIRFHHSEKLSDSEKKIIGESPIVADAITLMIAILGIMKRKNRSLSGLVKEIPEYTSAERFVPAYSSASRIMRKFCSGEKGTIRNDSDCRILIKPRGSGFMLYAESFKSETASEMCGFYEREIEKM